MASPTPHAAAGANAAGDGVQNVQSAPPAMQARSSTPYTPHEASTDTYAAQSTVTGGGDDGRMSSLPAHGLATTPIAGTGAWNPEWQRRFEKLQLAPADVSYLAQAGYSDSELFDIAMELDRVDMLDPSAPEQGVNSGSVASADGPVAADVMRTGQPGAVELQDTAWTPQWERKFTGVMERMGMSTTEIREQLAGVEGQPLDEAQLTEAYAQMEASIGDFDDAWRTKFETALDELDTPAAERKQVLEQLSASALTDAQLQDALTQMEGSKPAWDQEWESQFKALQVPEDMIAQLAESGAPKVALEQQLRSLIDLKMEFKNDGRLKRLEDAKATPEEKWGVMTQGLEGKDFDATVDQIKSSHVSGWRRIGSLAVNLIPGVYALQFLTGKDWITGEKIDRSNPLNIIGAVASGFAGFTAVRSAVAGVQGLSAASRAATATMQMSNGSRTLTGAVNAVSAAGKTAPLAQGSLDAINAAGLATKFAKGLKFTDYLKAATPIVNRFGEAGRLSSVGRGYYQGMQLASGAAAMTRTAEGLTVVDKSTKAAVLGELRQGRSITDALGAAGGRSGAVFASDDIARSYSQVGFLQGGVGRAVDGSRVVRGNGNFTINPFRNTRTIASTNDPNVLSLGRGINFASRGGLAQGIGAVQGITMASNAGLASSAVRGANQLMSSGAASRATGLNFADDAQRAVTYRQSARWAQELGVTGQGGFRSLLQLTAPSNRNAARVAGVLENGASGGYRAARIGGDAARKFGTYVATPLVGGAVVGITGKQMQPGWEYLKNRGEIKAAEREARDAAEVEAADLERLYAEQNGGATGPSDAQDGAQIVAQPQPITAPVADPQAPQVVGTAPTGGQLVYDPSYGAVIDTSTGDVYDPNTGELVGNLNQTQAAAATAPAGSGEVYVDPTSGYYIDPTTGLMADPSTGQVFDLAGNIVGNVNDQTAA